MLFDRIKNKINKTLFLFMFVCLSSLITISSQAQDSGGNVKILPGQEQRYYTISDEANKAKARTEEAKKKLEAAQKAKNDTVKLMDRYERNGGCDGHPYRGVTSENLSDKKKEEIIKKCGKELAEQFFSALEAEHEAQFDYDQNERKEKILSKQAEDLTVEGAKTKEAIQTFQNTKSEYELALGEKQKMAKEMDDKCSDWFTNYMNKTYDQIMKDTSLKNEIISDCGKDQANKYFAMLKKYDEVKARYDAAEAAVPEGSKCGGSICRFDQVCRSIQSYSPSASVSYTTYVCEDAKYDQATGDTTAYTAEEQRKRRESQIARIENAACNIQEMRERYQSSCYSCIIIKTLITTFMDACAKVQDITTEAGVIILQVALMLWLMFFVLKQISGFTNIEPGNMINTLFITLFKCLVAYVFITSGVSAFTTYIIEPLMDAGASYGIGLMKSSPAHLDLTPQTTVTSKGTSIVSARLINNIMGFTESLDKTVSTNLIIGHALTCHSFHAGMWQWDAVITTIKIPNIWIWLCGAAIWFCGFMLTLGIGYYLLDISFKLGFAIIAFPVVAALWPFDVTKDKFQKCVSIVLKSAATFTMLAMTASYALVLVSSSLRNLDEFFERIEAGDSDWIADTFDITGPYFIIIIFAYLYSLKLISSTINDYVNQFFPDGVMGNQTPMHHQLTRITDMAKQKAMKPVSYAKDVVTHQAGRLGGAVAGGAIKGVVNGAKFVKNKITGENKSQKSSSNNTNKQNNP